MRNDLVTTTVGVHSADLEEKEKLVVVEFDLDFHFVAFLYVV